VTAPKEPTKAAESKVTPAAKKKCTKVAAKKKCTRIAAKDAAAPVRVNVGTLKDELILSQKAELEALRGEFERQKETIGLQQQRIVELESQIFNMLMDNNNRICLQEQQQTQSISIAAPVTPKDANSTVDDKDDNETAFAHESDEREIDI